jgi:hypothetical protein
MISSTVCSPLSEEQHLLKVIYSMIKHLRKTHLLYAITQVNIFWGKEQNGEKERAREEKGKSERLSMAEKGLWHQS